MSETERLYRRNQGTTDVAFDEGLRRYMLGVYNYMSMGVAVTALVGLFFMTNRAAFEFASGLSFIPFIGVLALGFFAPKMIFNGSTAMAHGAYWAYVGLWGLLIGPVVAAYAGAGLGLEIVKAFFITVSIFAATSIYGYTTKKDLAPWGKFLFMASIGFLVAIVVNFFLQSEMFSYLISMGVVLLVSAITAYETQMVRNLYVAGAGEANQRASIFGAFALYGSFVTLFIHILNLLGMTRD
ncbi:integral membrane protein [Parvularcula bermudensis HTCC2503]|uniref:Integral membrane protein n=1 Tax=Parvularcula bermudensis (strain ATCC BAA-594 / HTCC2503 / KCTC 12087) TaxID=314260 RepID=E0TG86_PARBH|nr:Bax inhibitor-1/YccA family protein [Parvularcula bermudensis]ADM09129.1 integral membrane protein [Parvularcula bermudensis HTCC2503]